MSKLIQITNKHGRVSLNDGVHKDSIDQLLVEIGAIFGANAAELGSYTGELTNQASNGADTMELVINSGGGSVFEGYRLYNAIKDMRARGVHVTAKIDTMAASMGSVVAMAADKITMVSNGRIMIHEVKTGVHGDAADLTRAADLCEDMSNQIATIYSERTGQAVDEVRDLMKKETWMNANQAISNGFIDEIFNHETNEMIFKSTAEIKALKDQLETFKASAETYSNHIDTLNLEFQTALQAQTDENTRLTNEIAAREVTVAALTAEVEALKIISPEKIAAAAARLLTNQGHGQPVALGTEPLTPDNKTRTMEEYKTMSAQAVLAFVRNGGIFTN